MESWRPLQEENTEREASPKVEYRHRCEVRNSPWPESEMSWSRNDSTAAEQKIGGVGNAEKSGSRLFTLL
jgi:hypothetical protein